MWSVFCVNMSQNVLSPNSCTVSINLIFQKCMCQITRFLFELKVIFNYIYYISKYMIQDFVKHEGLTDIFLSTDFLIIYVILEN